MRRVQKEQATELVKLLEQAHDEIKQNIERMQLQSAMDILQDCQNAAITLGNLIESTEGEGFVTISMLEAYCEQVYRLYERLAGGEAVDARKEYKALRKSLAQIAVSIREDIKVRKEAVFLPYKASMWDSLESVWKAADEDPDCDAYVIPIPYYDKNPDGSFREEHYEAELYPDYVPITRYDAYDFENNHPDLIFIHNPYDQYNYVTSVHPFFYSKNLKKYTDKLVYIPYFVLNEVDPANQSAVERIEHFAQTTGVMNADVVIVQSEDMRQIYIDSMVKVAGEETRALWEQKILGLGSPKFDKVCGSTGQDMQLPESWEKLMRKADGSHKKVILYNTSVNALLEHGEHMLTKMRAVFRTFQEHQDEVTLLWRPHPLIKATISSLQPQLWQAYEKLVQKYREEGWGIYDDSADLNRAIALSDAYYGDPSSVVRLCHEAGLTVMIQDVEIV